MGASFTTSWLPTRARSWTGWSCVGALLLLAASLAAADPNFPTLSGRVVDDAGILDATTIQNLSATLEKHEQATGEQVVVVTLKSLGGYSIEDFGYQLGRHWGIGQKGKNTGAMLIVVPSEHKVRIEVGYGLEGKLTDAISRTIIDGEILPNFRRGDFNAGVLAGTASILSVLGGSTLTGTETSSSEPASNWLFPLVIMILVIFTLLRNLFGSRYGYYRRGFRGYGGSFDGGFSGGGGGGGFSGGGGSFGGGGASGSW